ncbi:vegetative cell wall protein gp1 [Xylaria cf. heliscus]|nr:vegetative cell wall protein gp1 [Xylaria cf. heliscus]
MSHYGPSYAGTPHRGGEPYYNYDVNSPSPTPSPHHYPFYPAKTPQRSSTRNHARGASTGFGGDFIPRPTTAFSPRYKSTGEYATGPSPQVSSRKRSFSHNKGSKHHHHVLDHHDYPPHVHAYPAPARRGERRRSFTCYRASYGDSDEDEVIEAGNGYVYVLRPEWRGSRNRNHYDFYTDRPEHGTDSRYYPQAIPTSFFEKEKAEYARYEEPPLRSATRVGHHSRRPSSGAVPNIQRPATTRPTAAVPKKTVTAPTPRATEADAKKHRIPTGYSLKNWDPTEEPIMLLGSVFDANSLGKWIYDWTVYHHGPATPISDMAGEMWLLLIQLSGKIKRSEEVVPQVRTQENREMIEDFIESGERLTDKLRSLLKRCEAPMLKASKKREAAQLGKNSGIEFVETLFGRERELEKTERFMQSVRLWNLRFDANCEDILKRPTQ